MYTLAVMRVVLYVIVSFILLVQSTSLL